GAIGEGAVSVVDVEHVVPMHRENVHGGDVDIDVAVAIHVGHGDAGLPAVGIGHAGPLGDVLEPIIPLVQVQPVGSDVGGEVEVRQAVVVDVAHRHSTTVVEVHVGENVERRVVGQPVDERHTGALRGQRLEELRLAGATAGRGQHASGDEERQDRTRN